MLHIFIFLLASGCDAFRIRKQSHSVLKQPEQDTLWRWILAEANLQQLARGNISYPLRTVPQASRPIQQATQRVEFLEYLLYGGDPSILLMTYSFAMPHTSMSTFIEQVFQGTIGRLGVGPWGPSCGQSSLLFFNLIQAAAGKRAAKHGNRVPLDVTEDYLSSLDDFNRSQGHEVGTSRERHVQEAVDIAAESQYKGLNHRNRQGLVDRIGLDLPQGAILDYIRVHISAHSFLIEKRANGICAIYQTWDGSYGLAEGVFVRQRGSALPNGAVTCEELAEVMNIALEGGVEGWDPSTRILTVDQKAARQTAQVFMAGDNPGGDRLRLDRNRHLDHKWLLSWEAFPESDVLGASQAMVDPRSETNLPSVLHQRIQEKIGMWHAVFAEIGGNTALSISEVNAILLPN